VFHSVGDWVFSSRVSYQGSPVGQLPVYDAGSLGGMLNMTAFAIGQLKGDDTPADRVPTPGPAPEYWSVQPDRPG